MSHAIKDNTTDVAQFWNRIAPEVDAIYSGNKAAIGHSVDRWFRADMYGRFEGVMERAEDLGPNSRICDIGCGSGRFVEALARRGASRILGIDIAPQMIALATHLVAERGVADHCEFWEGDVLDWQGNETFDLTIAIGFRDYIADPTT